jgi:hypothetical protein
VRRLAPFLGALVLALSGAATASAHPSAADCSRGYYMNVSGHCIHSPSKSPVGATARCRDGTYSYSEHASGTCSYHGGVRIWIHHP